MSWDELCGSTMSVRGAYDAAYARVRKRDGSSGVGSIYGAPGSTGQHPSCQRSPTTGAILALDFGEVLQLTQEYYAPGPLGTFNLQLSVTVVNNQYVHWNNNEYELAIMPMNSGVFVNERGTSSTFLSLLTKQGVLDSLQ